VFAVPYWKAHIDLSVVGYSAVSFVMNIFSMDPPAVTSSTIPCLNYINVGSPAFAAGLVTATAFEVPLIALLFASVFVPGAAEAASLAWASAIILGLPLILGLVPQLYATKSDRVSYAAAVLGMFLPLISFASAAANVIEILVRGGLAAIPWPDV